MRLIFVVQRTDENILTAKFFSDKLTKLASVQEANVTATVNGMQRYLELLIREGEEESKGMNQLTITSFAVTTPLYSQVPRPRSPIRSSLVKRIQLG